MSSDDENRRAAYKAGYEAGFAEGVRTVNEDPDDSTYIGTIYGQCFLLLKRQAWAGLLTAQTRRPAHPSRSAAKRRAQFFEDIGHTDACHSTIDRASERAALDAAPRFFRAMSGMRRFVDSGHSKPRVDHLSHCGWWWCEEAEFLTDSEWAGLTRAYETIRRGRRDPWSPEVGLVAIAWEEMRYRAFEREQTIEALTAQRSLLSRIDGMSNVASDVRRLIRRLEKKVSDLGDAVSVGVVGGGQTDIGRRAALVQARAFGLPPSIVAAISVLACADPDGLENFDQHAKSIRAAVDRMNATTKRQTSAAT